MNDILLLRKLWGAYEAIDVETGKKVFSANTRKFVLENAVREGRILIIDETFKDKKHL